MEKELILLKEYCGKSGMDVGFIFSLAEEGLVELKQEADENYLLFEQLHELELFSRLHYDLSVNVPGIDIIHNLLDKMRTMNQEINILRRQLSGHESFSDVFFDEL